jgi:Zn-dependent peptidase ImmA (M78 family)
MIKDLLNNEITQNELLNYYNATIEYSYLPDSINGMVFNYLNINIIVINQDLSYYKKKKTILHELAHIELNHLNQVNSDLFEFSIDKRDDEADKYIKLIMERN